MKINEAYERVIASDVRYIDTATLGRTSGVSPRHRSRAGGDFRNVRRPPVVRGMCGAAARVTVVA
ncbi:hypothetical protein [Streptomyces sp. NPDC046197]|uniref:hypothetical protein n=1 Tax=Streptomyces sp. NPDC046197 TaxID=3154337 RepID=UPI0034106F8D